MNAISKATVFTLKDARTIQCRCCSCGHGTLLTKLTVSELSRNRVCPYCGESGWGEVASFWVIANQLSASDRVDLEVEFLLPGGGT